MWPDHYSGTFYSMITEHQEKFNLPTEDVAEYYFEAIFLLSMQVIFCLVILKGNDFEEVFEPKDEPSLSWCQLFTALILHFASVFSVRNGIQMCKFVIYNTEKTKHPVSAMCLGILVILVNMFCEATNLITSLS